MSRFNKLFHRHTLSFSSFAAVLCLASCASSPTTSTTAPVSGLLVKGKATDDKKFTVNVQPILVAKSDGSEMINQKQNWEVEATNKIMAQADIQVNFLKPITYKNDAMWSGLFDGKLDVEKEIGKSPANMKDWSKVYVFFAHNISTKRRVGGMGQEPGNIVFIAEWAIEKGFKHVIAHELCHNLGLGHENFGASKSRDRKIGKNVMYGVEPKKLGDIFPDGKQLSQLNQEQVEKLRTHKAVRPAN